MKTSRSIASLRLHGRTAVIHQVTGWRWQPRERAHYNLWICLRGEGVMDLNGRSYDVHPGAAVLISPRAVVRASGPSGAPMHNIGMHFHLQRHAAAALLPWTDRAVDVHHLSLLRELAHYLQSLLLDPASTRREAEGVARQMLRVFLRELQTPQEDAVTRDIRRQAAEIGLDPGTNRSVDLLAGEVGLSTSQYTRRFRELLGTTPVRFMIDRRIDEARRFLRETPLGLDQIARQLGYKDQAFFSRQFKARTGMPPWRHRHAVRRAKLSSTE